MAQQNEILLTIYRDKFAPFDPSQGKTVYNPPIGKSFNVNTIKSIRNVVEGGVTYGAFAHYVNDSAIRTEVLTTQASGTIIGLCNQ